jgi:hypothetical protein
MRQPDEDESEGYRTEAAYEVSHRLDPEPCGCGGEWNQVGYDRDANGAELAEFECTGCRRLEAVVGDLR